MTLVRLITFGAGAWVPRPSPPRAVMPIRVDVAGDATGVVVDICTHLKSALAWGTDETVIPLDSVPREALDDAGEFVAGAVVVAVAENQPLPHYADGNPQPDVIPVYLTLEQPVSSSLRDVPRLIERRRDLLRVLSDLEGRVG